MWLISRDGFYSVVQKPEDRADDMVTIRARRREDLEAWLVYAPEAVIVDTPHGDYPCRMRLKREAMAAIVARTALDINYSNFKATVKENARHDIYLSVWSALRRLENKLRPWQTVALPFPSEPPKPWTGALERTKQIIESRKRGNGRKRKRLNATYQPTDSLIDTDDIPFDD